MSNRRCERVNFLQIKKPSWIQSTEMGNCSRIRSARNMKCYLAGKDHKQQSSVQQDSLAKKKKSRQKLGLGLPVDDTQK